MRNGKECCGDNYVCEGVGHTRESGCVRNLNFENKVDHIFNIIVQFSFQKQPHSQQYNTLLNIGKLYQILEFYIVNFLFL
jgi:hypothetical protein